MFNAIKKTLEKSNKMNAAVIYQNIPTGKPLTMFRKMHAFGSLLRLWGKIAHRNFRLLDLDETLKNHPAEACHHVGLKAVSINHIRGTLNKNNEFDTRFYPMQERSRTRWMGIALEKLRGHDLPPVDLIQIGDIYYVRDGHHRISVSRAMGQAFVDAEVTFMQLRQQSLFR